MQLLARGAAGVDGPGRGQRALGVDVQERVDLPVDVGDAVEVGLGDLDGADGAGCHLHAEFGCRQRGELAHPSSPRICGTRNLSSSTAGAPASTFSTGSDGRTTSSR